MPEQLHNQNTRRLIAPFQDLKLLRDSQVLKCVKMGNIILRHAKLLSYEIV